METNSNIKKSLIIFRFCSINQFNLDLSNHKQIELFSIYNGDTIYDQLPIKIAMKILNSQSSLIQQEMFLLYSTFVLNFRNLILNSDNSLNIKKSYEILYRDIIMNSQFIKNRNLVFSYQEINFSFYYNNDDDEFQFYNDIIDESLIQLQNAIHNNEQDELYIVLDDGLINNNLLNIIFPQNFENNASFIIKEFDCSKKYLINNINFEQLSIDLGGYHINKENNSSQHFVSVNDKFTILNDSFFVINDLIDYESEITRTMNQINTNQNEIQDNLIHQNISVISNLNRTRRIKVNNIEINPSKISQNNKDFFNKYVRETNNRQIRKKRQFNYIQHLFKNNLDLNVILFDKQDLEMPSTFTKDKVVVFKQGQIIDKRTLQDDEGFYISLEKGHYVSIQLKKRMVTFRRLDTCEDRYILELNNYTDVKISKRKGCNFFNVTNIKTKYQFLTNEFQYFIDEDEIAIDEQSFIIGSITEGDSIENDIDICLLENTKIKTDQGWILIKNISKINTINNYKIVGYTKGFYKHNYIVKIEKNAFGINLPNQDLLITPEHSLYIMNKFILAGRLANNKKIKKIYFIPYTSEMGYVYNLLFKEWLVINANNIAVETLHPKYNQNNSVILF